MKKNYYFLAIVMLSTLTSCTKIKVTAKEDVEVNDFIWKGMNQYYLWQKNINNLSDARFFTVNEYEKFLSREDNASLFFESLLYQKDVIDKWSWIVDDYTTLEDSFQGISMHNGMEYGVVFEKGSNTNVFGYVRYVLPNSDAAAKNVTRGLIFDAVNGTQLTNTNYTDLLFTNTDYTINLADYNDGNPVGNGSTISLSKSAYQENPVFISKTITSGNRKIGYLMYNSFTANFDDELNAAFLALKNENITQLILDLRYNGGGSVRTAGYLASMITGQFTGQLFSKNYWNSKINLDPSNLENKFTNQINNGIVQEPIHSLSLNQVYIITTNSSASASELVINGLIPYIDVKKIGAKTRGKYVGSITLYDSPNFNKENSNTNHTWAMQPIVLEIKNKLDENDKDGFEPDEPIAENYANLGVLGTTSDPLLQRAISYISIGAKGDFAAKETEMIELSNSKLALPTGNNMYVELK